MDEEEFDFPFDLSEWTVVDEDVSDGDKSQRRTNKSKRTQNRRRSSTNSRQDKDTKPKSGSRIKSSSTATSRKRQSSKGENSRTSRPLKDSRKSTACSSTGNTKDKIGESVVSSSGSEVTCTGNGDSVKITESVSEKAATAGEGRESSSGSQVTSDTTAPCEGETKDSLKTAQSTSLMTACGGLPICSASETHIHVDTQVTASAPLKESTSSSSLMLNSTEDRNIDVMVNCSQETTLIPESAPSSTESVAKLAASAVCNTSMQSSIQMKNKTHEVGSIAEVMEAVNKGVNINDHKEETDCVSDTESVENIDIAKCLMSKPKKPRVTGTKRNASLNNREQVVKKTKLHSSSDSAKCERPEGPTGKKNVRQCDQKTENQNQKSPKQHNQDDKMNEHVKTSSRHQHPGGISSTHKGSFRAAKTPVTKNKSSSAVSLSAKTSTTTNEVDKKPAPLSTGTTTSSTSMKRIIRRFHRMTQTVPTRYCNKLIQCFIRIPSLDAPPKANCHTEVQTSLEDIEHGIFYKKALPDTVRPEIFAAVAAFNVNNPGSRNIITGSYNYGISLGHFTAADVDKSMFRESLLNKCAYYILHFDRQDFGVVDLFFDDEEQFVAMVTHIRKTKIGSRHLVVTYHTHLKETDRSSESPVSSVKATIIYNQNFASTSYLTHVKAPVWAKPKVETLTVHNMPEGIPLNFLKLIIPDAVTIELDDKKQKFSQKGSCVYLGMDRKNGGDAFLKLFTQMYVNNECLAFSASGTSISDVPDLSAILEEKENRECKMKSLKELQAVPRDISCEPLIGDKEEVDVVMQVDNVENVEKVLLERASAWTGPSTLEKLLQPLCPPKSSTLVGVPSCVKDPALSDVSEDLSDISDTSYIGVETVSKKSQRRTLPAESKTCTPGRTSATQLTTYRRGIKDDPPKGASLRKSKMLSSKDSTFIKKIQDRLQYKGRKNQLSERLNKRIERIRVTRPLRLDARKEKLDRVRRVPYSGREKERSIPRYTIRASRVRVESRLTSNRSLRRERPHVERLSSDRVSSNRDHRRTAKDRERHYYASSRPERDRRRSEEKDNRKIRLTSSGDIHGYEIAGVYKREKSERMRHDSLDRMREQFSDDELDRIVYHERDTGRGSILDSFVRKRLGSLERRERESTDSREVILTRPLSSRAKQTRRGRSTTPREHQSMSMMSTRGRQVSPSLAFEQCRSSAVTRSRSPPRSSHISALSPISVGEVDAEDSVEGMWLQQPPSILISQDMHRIDSSTRSTSYVKSQTDWKSPRSAREFDKKSFENSQRFIERFVVQMIEAKRASSKSGTSKGKESSKPFHDPSKVIEKIREMCSTKASYNNTGSQHEHDKDISDPIPHRIQTKSRPGDRIDPVSGLNAARSPSNTTISSSHGIEQESVDRCENRGSYGRNVRDMNDAQRFDTAVNNRNLLYGREYDDIPSQTHSAGYEKSTVLDQPHPRRYRETDISNFTSSEGYQKSDMQDHSVSEKYIDSGMSDWQNDGDYKESEMSDSGRYREPETPYQQNSVEYRESDNTNHPGPDFYHHNQHAPLPAPVPPPVVPPLYNTTHPPQEKYDQFGYMAPSFTTNMGKEPNQATSNSGPGMWNNPPLPASSSGQQPYTAGPQFPFCGAAPGHVPNMHFSGPPPPIGPPNIHQPFVRVNNPQSAPWPHSHNF